MPSRQARLEAAIPEPAFLREVEARFSVTLPEVFIDFCRQHAGADVFASFPGLRRGAFLVDFPTLEAINSQIGTEEWGDYERIIAGKEQPKSGLRLWGGLVPFYRDDPKRKRGRNAAPAASIYGFPSDTKSAKVLVWSVHTIVHAYPSFDAWLQERRR